MILLLMFLCFVGLVLLILSFKISRSDREKRKKFGIEDGAIVYSDIIRNEESLFSKKFNLSGKPDYIVRTKKGDIIPVEVKTGWHTNPLMHHIMQLMAYCQLIEETYGRTVPYGVLYYYDTGKRFRIPYDQLRKSDLERTIKQMLHSLKTGEVDINHDDPKRCEHCSMRRFCHEHLD